MPMLILGSHMGPHLQNQVKRQFIHRFTGDHKPAGARDSDAVQFASDADWLAHTYFWVNKSGGLSKRHKYCESHPTWPKNPDLRKS